MTQGIKISAVLLREAQEASEWFAQLKERHARITRARASANGGVIQTPCGFILDEFAMPDEDDIDRAQDKAS